ncbi:uncharacterized protein ACR2FA_004166 [Aphomia sociella]
MYIALKWLIGLSLAMWITMCCIDIYCRKSKEIRQSDLETKTFGFVFKNTTIPVVTHVHVENFKSNKNSYQYAMLHYIMFLAGAFAVCIFNKKNEIMSYTKNTISKIHYSGTFKSLRFCFINAAVKYRVAIIKFTIKTWINLVLLNKLKEVGEGRKNLGQLLIAAIHENKNIRTQYQLESMAKNRLLRHIDDTQKKIKENRSRYVSFQHLYLVTHQENLFLKARIGKLTTEKEEAEKNLLGLINEVYKTKNNELKVYCSRLIVRTKDNLLNSDVKAEIQKFLEKPKRCTVPNSNSASFRTQSEVLMNPMKSWPRCTTTRVTEVLQEDDCLVPLISDAPRLKGLPGEYIWTVKDKNGITEKLYEYDYESDVDNGDTIRRIRQYTVYFDKDCLLDFANSRTIIRGTNTDTKIRSKYVNYPMASERFLTGSEVFQKFLRNNSNITPTPIFPEPPLLCD